LAGFCISYLLLLGGPPFPGVEPEKLALSHLGKVSAPWLPEWNGIPACEVAALLITPMNSSIAGM